MRNVGLNMLTGLTVTNNVREPTIQPPDATIGRPLLLTVQVPAVVS
jgi:hypothetical protein